MKPSHKTILLWILLIGMFVLIYNLMKGSPSEAKKIPFSEFMADVNEKPQIFGKIKVRGNEIKGKYKSDAGGDKSGRKFRTYGLLSPQLLDKLDKGRVKYDDIGDLVWVDDDGDEVSLKAGVAEWAKTDDAKLYLPPRGASGSGDQPRNQSGGTADPNDRQARNRAAIVQGIRG